MINDLAFNLYSFNQPSGVVNNANAFGLPTSLPAIALPANIPSQFSQSIQSFYSPAMVEASAGFTNNVSVPPIWQNLTNALINGGVNLAPVNSAANSTQNSANSTAAVQTIASSNTVPSATNGTAQAATTSVPIYQSQIDNANNAQNNMKNISAIISSNSVPSLPDQINNAAGVTNKTQGSVGGAQPNFLSGVINSLFGANNSNINISAAVSTGVGGD